MSLVDVGIIIIVQANDIIPSFYLICPIFLHVITCTYWIATLMLIICLMRNLLSEDGCNKI